MEFEGAIKHVVHDVLYVIGRAAQIGLRAHTVEAVSYPVAHHTDIAHGRVGFDRVVGRLLDVVVADVDRNLLVGLVVFHERDVVAEALHVVEADHVP